MTPRDIDGVDSHRESPARSRSDRTTLARQATDLVGLGCARRSMAEEQQKREPEHPCSVERGLRQPDAVEKLGGRPGTKVIPSQVPQLQCIARARQGNDGAAKQCDDWFRMGNRLTVGGRRHRRGRTEPAMAREDGPSVVLRVSATPRRRCGLCAVANGGVRRARTARAVRLTRPCGLGTAFRGVHSLAASRKRTRPCGQ